MGYRSIRYTQPPIRMFEGADTVHIHVRQKETLYPGDNSLERHTSLVRRNPETLEEHILFIVQQDLRLVEHDTNLAIAIQYGKPANRTLLYDYLDKPPSDEQVQQAHESIQFVGAELEKTQSQQQ